MTGRPSRAKQVSVERCSVDRGGLLLSRLGNIRQEEGAGGMSRQQEA